jgi:hypothetical protein
MTDEQKGGVIEGGQVVIISEDMKNDGRIVSTGAGAKTHIETKKYRGTGAVESNAKQTVKESWLKKNLTQVVIGIAVTVIGGLILAYLL